MIQAFSGRVFCAALMVGLLSGTAAVGQEIGSTAEEVIERAKEEGRVRVAASWQGPIADYFINTFSEKYGIEVEQLRVRALASRERILSEMIGGLVETDLINVSGSLQPSYVEADVIVPVDWQTLFPKVSAQASPDNYFIATGFSRYGLIYNPDLVPEDRIPATWEDCLDPYWHDKIVVYTRPRTFTALWNSWGREKSLDYHEKLAAQNPVWVSDQSSTIQQIAAGEYEFACGMPYHSLMSVYNRDSSAEETTVFVVPPELPVHIGEAMAVTNGAESPNAAVLLAAFLASADGQVGYDMWGRSSPFIEGNDAAQMVAETGAEAVWGGWEFSGEAEAEAANEIIRAWGFPTGN